MQETIVIFGTATVILFVNEVVLFILLRLSRIEKHHTQQQNHSYLMRMATIIHFINTALIILVIHFKAYDPTVPEDEQFLELEEPEPE